MRQAAAKDFSWAVVPGASTPTGNVTVTDDGAAIVAATSAVRVRIERSPLRLAFLDAAGHVISEDAPRRGPLGARKFEPLTPQEVADAVVYAAGSSPSCVPDLVELRPLGAA